MTPIVRRGVMVAGIVGLLAAPAFAQDRFDKAALDAAMAATIDAVRDGLIWEQKDAKDRAAADREREQREAERKDRERDKEAAAFDQATALMDSSRWERAVDAFDRVAAMKGSRVDAALYWKAYSQDRLGQRAEALATIADLTRGYPSSRYVRQAQALEMEVRRNVGQPARPEAQGDEELKLMAINAMLNSDPEQALPVLEKLLQGPSSPQVRDRAIFVLAQSNSPKAQQILKDLAKGGSTPELQSKAIQYLGVQGGAESRAVLAEIYASSSDVDVKRRILRAFMVAGEKKRLMTAAQSEQNSDLRMEAVRQLGVMGATEEVWQLYQKETTVEVKKQILQALFIGGNAQRMIDLAKNEQNPELRLTAVRNLGLMGAANTGDALGQIYATDKDPEVKKAVINALFLQGNATALVAMARKEPDVQLKKDIVQKLSMMKDKAATDYMLELLSK